MPEPEYRMGYVGIEKGQREAAPFWVNREFVGRLEIEPAGKDGEATGDRSALAGTIDAGRRSQSGCDLAE